LKNSIYDSEVIFKQILNLKLEQHFRRLVLSHIMTILIVIFSFGYRGKTIQVSQVSEKHRTTIAHFLNHGCWEDAVLEQILKAHVVQTIYEEAKRTRKPVICIVNDTIASKTKPSSQAMYPMEATYFHQSHLKKKQDYEHQAVGVMLACNGMFSTMPSFCTISHAPKSKLPVTSPMSCPFLLRHLFSSVTASIVSGQ